MGLKSVIDVLAKLSAGTMYISPVTDADFSMTVLIKTNSLG